MTQFHLDTFGTKTRLEEIPQQVRPFLFPYLSPQELHKKKTAQSKSTVGLYKTIQMQCSQRGKPSLLVVIRESAGVFSAFPNSACLFYDINCSQIWSSPHFLSVRYDCILLRSICSVGFIPKVYNYIWALDRRIYKIFICQK